MPELTPEQAFTPIPASQISARNWLHTTMSRNTQGQCWRCGLTQQDRDDAGHNAAEWTAHKAFSDNKIVAQSCERATADLYDEVLAEYPGAILDEYKKYLAAH